MGRGGGGGEGGGKNHNSQRIEKLSEHILHLEDTKIFIIFLLPLLLSRDSYSYPENVVLSRDSYSYPEDVVLSRDSYSYPEDVVFLLKRWLALSFWVS